MAIEITDEGDVRVLVDKQDVKFWFGGNGEPDKSTKVWIYLNMPPALTYEQIRRKAAYQRRYRNGKR